MDSSDITFDSDGLRCAATLHLPDDLTMPLPCVVMGPGGTLTRRDGIPSYAERFASAGFATFAFDYRHWGDSDGQPRRWISIERQLQDWRAAIRCARQLNEVDPRRIAVWGMSLGGGHALLTAAAVPAIAAAIALVPIVDGLALLRKHPPTIALRMTGTTIWRTLSRERVMLPVAGPPRSLAVLAAPEALPGFQRVASANDWRNEADVTGTMLPFSRYKPVRHAARIEAPLLLEVGDHDAIAPLPPIEKVAARARNATLRRYPIDHFECFSAQHIDSVANDQIGFLRAHV